MSRIPGALNLEQFLLVYQISHWAIAYYQRRPLSRAVTDASIKRIDGA
ncbi:hypothetical protein [Carnimonas nigrificans]|nr:hypothetical protein [Carnimonas nigrificans]